MVTDWLVGLILDAVNAALDLLPVGQAPALPSLAPVWNLLGGIDSLVPILGPLTFMLGLLGLAVVFLLVRLVLVVWNLVWP